jgi:amino acid adenylation domain-containing protein/thioester reductase-like protein
MEQQLCNRANEASDSIAVIDGEQRFTYHDLLTKADILAVNLIKKGIEVEEPIGIVIGPGWQQVIAQVAVLRAGGTSTPIDPSVPDLQLHNMLCELEMRLVITTQDLSDRLSQFDQLLTESVLDPENQISNHDEVLVISGRPKDHISHLLHTSGSTGKPKAVQISSKAVMHLATSSPFDIRPGDNVGCLNNPGFDLSLFEIWATLLSGGTVVHIPNSIIKDPVSFSAFLKDSSITALILPATLCTAVSTSLPSAFQGLRHVISAGESPNPEAMQKVLTSDAPPKNVWNGYGPTETTCLSTVKQITLQDAQSGDISAGAPLGDTVVYIIDEDRKPILEEEASGEICIGGPGLSAGYLNHPEETAESFIELKVAESPDSDQVKVIRVYRTGDIGMWKGKDLQFCGRKDLQVKRQGFRVELEGVEQEIAATDGVYAAACLHEKSAEGVGSDHMGAFVAPEDGSSVEQQELIGKMQDRLPYYMVPDEVHVLDEMPLNSRGKVDRVALADEHLKSRSTKPSERPVNGDENTVDKVAKIIEGILGLDGLGPDDSVIALGLSSIQVARFLGLVKQEFGKMLSIKDLYTTPRIGSLAEYLDKNETANYGPSEVLQFEEDSHLADDIELVPSWLSEGRLFLTGATGFLGANLLYRLLSMSSMKEIACLARGNKHHSPLDRIQNTLKRYDLWNEHISQNMPKLIVLDGDMTKERLGLSQNDYQWLTGWAPAVLHSAAKVNWCDPYSAHFDQNILGTKNVLRVAADGRRKTFHYISSIDVWAVTGLILGTEVVSEDGPLKTHLASLPFDTGYAQSQWVADEMVQRVRNKGLPVTIYRPGFVIGDSKTGAGNPDDFFTRMLVGCVQMGYWPHLPYQNQEYVTVDYVCDSILQIASNNENVGRNFTLSAPKTELTTNMERLCTIVNEAGFPLKQISYSEWLEKLQAWKEFESSPLLSLMPLLAEPVLRGATRLQTSKFSPVYECKNTSNVLGNHDGGSFVKLTPDHVRRLVDFQKRKGFYNL